MVSQRISIEFEGLSVQAELNDSPCAGGLLGALPLQAEVNTWGEEIYFSIGLDLPAGAGARSDMAVGEVAYWPPGRAFCIFFGRTPASGADGAPRAASDVEPLGRVVGDVEVLKGVRDAEHVTLSAAS